MTAQATSRQLAHLNRLRRAKGYVEIHPDDWVGVPSGQADRLIKQWERIGPARSGRAS